MRVVIVCRGLRPKGLASFLLVKVGASGGFGEAECDGDDVVGVGVLDIDGR